MPVDQLPDQVSVRSYGVLETEALNRLVLETSHSDGIVGFYALELSSGGFFARLAGGLSLPSRLVSPPFDSPVTVDLGGTGNSRYWVLGGELSPVRETQYISAVPLPERRFADLSEARFPELPPAASGLAIDVVTVDATGSEVSRCTIEPNLNRIRERMTPVFADWVLAQGRPHLLVGMAFDAGDGPWPVIARLYSPDLELVDQTGELMQIDPNRLPVPLLVDLDADASDEIVVFSSAGSGPALVVLETGPGGRDGSRILALNDCHLRMNGEDVRSVQRELERRGYSVGEYGIDGWYGPDTRAAVVRFQRDADLVVTGVVDNATWRALGLW